MGALGLIVLGLAGLIGGGDLLVRGSVAAATAWRISPMVIGLTLVGFGTSMPELMTSLQAAFAGAPGIAVGNVVGSNIGNVLLILGLAALVAPIGVSRLALQRDGAIMLGATILCVGIASIGILGRLSGLALVAALALYLWLTLRAERRAQGPAGDVYEAEAAIVAQPQMRVSVALLMALAGLALTVLGARALVSGAVTTAEALGLSEAVIGLTIVAIGTSMPELVTAVMAVRQGQGDVALGNVIGSNIFNILGILGITALVHPMRVPPEILAFDIWVMLGAAVLLLIFARTGWTVSRREGAVFVGLYLGYLAILLTGSLAPAAP